MAVMKATRTLRVAPGGESTGVEAPQGAKVTVLDTDPPWIKVRLSSEGNPEGWVSAAAVDQQADVLGPLDKLVFATECAWEAVVFGVSAHYLIMTAELRTNVIDGPNADNVRHGPFGLSQDFWSAYMNRPEFGVAFVAQDRQNWIVQCLVFAMATNINQKALALLLSDQPTVAELCLAQLVGTKAALGAIVSPGTRMDAIIQGISDAELNAEGILRDDLSRILGPVGAKTGGEVMQELAAKVKLALDNTRQYASQAGAEILKASDSALASTGPLNLQINFESPEIPAARRDMAILISTRFAEAGYGTLQQVAAIANSIAESRLNPKAASPPPERSFGLFQLNQAGVGAGFSQDVLKDPEQNIAIMLNHMATRETAADVAFRASVSIQEAISIFVRKFERPADASGAITRRVAIAKTLTI